MGQLALGQRVREGQLTLGPDIRESDGGTAGPRAASPGGQMSGGTADPRARCPGDS